MADTVAPPVKASPAPAASVDPSANSGAAHAIAQRTPATNGPSAPLPSAASAANAPSAPRPPVPNGTASASPTSAVPHTPPAHIPLAHRPTVPTTTPPGVKSATPAASAPPSGPRPATLGASPRPPAPAATPGAMSNLTIHQQMRYQQLQLERMRQLRAAQAASAGSAPGHASAAAEAANPALVGFALPPVGHVPHHPKPPDARPRYPPPAARTPAASQRPAHTPRATAPVRPSTDTPYVPNPALIARVAPVRPPYTSVIPARGNDAKLKPRPPAPAHVPVTKGAVAATAPAASKKRTIDPSELPRAREVRRRVAEALTLDVRTVTDPSVLFRPFESKEEAIRRLVSFHILTPEQPSQESLRTADQAYNAVAQMLIDKANSLKSKMRDIELTNALHAHPPEDDLVVARLLAEDEREELARLTQPEHNDMLGLDPVFEAALMEGIEATDATGVGNLPIDFGLVDVLDDFDVEGQLERALEMQHQRHLMEQLSHDGSVTHDPLETSPPMHPQPAVSLKLKAPQPPPVELHPPTKIRLTLRGPMPQQ